MDPIKNLIGFLVSDPAVNLAIAIAIIFIAGGLVALNALCRTWFQLTHGAIDEGD